MTLPSARPAPKLESFSLSLFAFTLLATLAGLGLLLRFIAPATWHLQLIAPGWAFVVGFLVVNVMTAFIEYFFHRYVLHRPLLPGLARLYRQHTLHHALTRIGRKPTRDGRGLMVVENIFPIIEPEQGEGSFFPWYTLAVFGLALTPVFIALQWLVPAIPWFLSGFVGLACALTLYEVLHAINHWSLEKWEPLLHHRFFGRFWRSAYSFHLRHHAAIDCNESISGFFSLPITDWVFGTCIMPPTIYADGEEWEQANFVAPRPGAFIRFVDRVADKTVAARRTSRAEAAATAGPAPAVRTYTRGEEIANWLTHGIGAILSVAALTLLIVFASLKGDAWHVVSFTVFGLSLLLLYTASTLYHLSKSERWRYLFRRLDHSSIFLLIAGTYTPFLLTSLRGPWGWSLFGVVWGLCGAGAIFKFFGPKRSKWISVTAFLFAGWLILVACKPMLELVPAPALWLLLAGGLCYTIGVPFYLWRRLRYHHACWHSFVIGGSTCHFLAVLLFLLPARG